MKSPPIGGILKVFGWMAFYLLLSAAFYVASANSTNSFVLREARVFDGGPCRAF